MGCELILGVKVDKKINMTKKERVFSSNMLDVVFDRQNNKSLKCISRRRLRTNTELLRLAATVIGAWKYMPVFSLDRSVCHGRYSVEQCVEMCKMVGHSCSVHVQQS